MRDREDDKLENMVEIKVNEIYEFDTISKTNNNAWKIIGDGIAEQLKSGDDILLDFENINVIEPWANDNFMKLMRNENIHLRFYYSPKIISNLNIACLLGKLKTNRFYNVEVEEVEVKPVEDKMVTRISNELQDYIVQDDHGAMLEIYRRFDQLGGKNTIKYIESAIKLFNKNTGVKDVILNTGDISIQDSILEDLVGAMGRLIKNNIRLNVLSNDKEVMSRIRLHQHMVVSKHISNEDKYKMVKEFLPEKAVGMLITYRPSKKLDEFGREGNGEALHCRVAIFDGIVKNNKMIKLKFRTYNGNTFYTMEHWGLENDGVELQGLEEHHIDMPIEHIGLMDKFLGSKYQFILPVQIDPNDMDVVYSMENDKLVKKKVTIPERIKIVLDDWKIEYNESSLINCIIKTRKLLKLDE